jgi:hypothetical protein
MKEAHPRCRPQEAPARSALAGPRLPFCSTTHRKRKPMVAEPVVPLPLEPAAWTNQWPLGLKKRRARNGRKRRRASIRSFMIGMSWRIPHAARSHKRADRELPSATSRFVLLEMLDDVFRCRIRWHERQGREQQLNVF